MALELLMPRFEVLSEVIPVGLVILTVGGLRPA